MTLQDLILAHHWLSVEQTLVGLYPDQQEAIDEYRVVFEKLAGMEPEAIDMKLVLTADSGEEDAGTDQRSNVDVLGRKPVQEEEGIVEQYALEFVPWAQWLGIGVPEEVRENFTDLQIIAHCLYEMTYVSFDEDEIQSRFKAIQDDANAYKNMTTEQKQEQTITLEEFIKQISAKGDL